MIGGFLSYRWIQSGFQRSNTKKIIQNLNDSDISFRFLFYAIHLLGKHDFEKNELDHGFKSLLEFIDKCFPLKSFVKTQWMPGKIQNAIKKKQRAYVNYRLTKL